EVGRKPPEFIDERLIARAFRLKHGQAFFRAQAFTGDGESFRSRPFGRSGCVTTAATANSGLRQRARRPGHANSADPMNTTLTAVRSRPVFAGAPLRDVRSNRSDARAWDRNNRGPAWFPCRRFRAGV